jgi:hypothetical protein
MHKGVYYLHCQEAVLCIYLGLSNCVYLWMYARVYTNACLYVHMYVCIYVQGLDKIMETPQILYTFLYQYCVGPLFPSIEPQSFLEWTRTSSEQSLAEFYTILLEEHLQVVSEMLEVGICSSL